LFRPILFFVLFFAGANVSLGQTTDTARFYYKNYPEGLFRVSGPQDADFLRVIARSSDEDRPLNVKEYYLNGKIRLVGKSVADIARSFQNGDILLDGDCITYDQDGKKQSFVNYIAGQKNGMEYRYFPNGSIYCSISNEYKGSAFKPKVLYRDCYDLNGNLICKDGNGQWIEYDQRDNIELKGPVKDGLKEGVWHGIAKINPSIKYICKYNKGEMTGGTGYDLTGRAYPFKNDTEPPYYSKSDPVTFMQVFRRHFKIPKDASGKKMSLDGLFFTFVIEKDGTLSSPGFVDNKGADLDESVKEALQKCKSWSPALCYGIPLRCRLTFVYKEFGGYMGDAYVTGIKYKAEIIGF